MSAVVHADGLCFRYGEEPVFANVRFEIRRGDFAAIIGANGSGKSTLLRLMLGELSPNGGSIRLFGQPPRSGSARLFGRPQRRGGADKAGARPFAEWTKVGYLPQHGLSCGDQFPATAEEIVLSGLYSHIGPLRRAKPRHRERAHAALALAGAGDLAKKPLGELSGGQRQRVMVARVLAPEPELLLLDEPTTGVDTRTSEAILELLAQLSREANLTSVMVTHNISAAAGLVTRVLCLEDGSLVELDEEQVERELTHKHKHPAESTTSGNGHTGGGYAGAGHTSGGQIVGYNVAGSQAAGGQTVGGSHAAGNAETEPPDRRS